MPAVYPREIPKTIVPSFIGEPNQVLNLLTQHGMGDHIKDHSGLGNHETNFGADWVDGPWGWGLNYNGLIDYGIVLDALSLRLVNFTVEVWVNVSSFANDWSAIIMKRDTAVWNTTNYGLYTRAAGNFNIEFISGVTIVTASSPGGYLAGTWYHLIGTYGANLTLYINGAVAGGPIPSVLVPYTGPEPVNIGRDPLAPAKYFPGVIALCRIYNVDKGAAYARRSFEDTRSIFGV